MEYLFKEMVGKKSISDFPQTRYQGSKYKLLNWIWERISFLNFDSVIDLFGGTAAVSYLFKTKGKTVTYNDLLKSNYLIGNALIENNSVQIDEYDIQRIMNDNSNGNFKLISRLFKDIYFTDEENNWLDNTIQNIYNNYAHDKYKKSILIWALFQSCIIKRPFNLFHRKNLYLRMNDVKRSFGNKATWDKSFESCFRKFSSQINNAVFNNGEACMAMQKDAININNVYDLVYIDTPYISSRGIGVDYLHFYHFLEGIADYYNWEDRIDFNRKHLPIFTEYNRWLDKLKIADAFIQLIGHYRNSHIVISYRSDGIPSISELVNIVKQFKKNYKIEVSKNYKYVLSTNNNSDEILIIGWD